MTSEGKAWAAPSAVEPKLTATLTTTPAASCKRRRTFVFELERQPSYNGCMVAAKEKTLSFNPESIVKRMDNKPARTPATKTTSTVINRISSYDFRTRKFKKSPIGSAEKTHSIVPVKNQQQPRKRIGENRVELGRLHRAPCLAYFRARYYDPTNGEFVSQDPLEYVDGMSLMRAYFAPNTVDPHGTGKGVKIGVGVTAYKGVGGGGSVNLQAKEVPCCLPNGTKALNTIYSLNGHLEVGIGVGAKINIMLHAVSLQWIVAKIQFNLTGACETGCGKTITACCKICADLAIDLPLLGPATDLSAGLLSFSISGSGKLTGSIRACWNTPSCLTPGLAIGFCGRAGYSIRVTWGWFFAEDSYEKKGCFPLLGNAGML